MKEYRSFTEILNLQREIDLEHFKLSLNRFRTDLYPTQLLGGFKGMIQKTVITFILQKLRKIRR